MNGNIKFLLIFKTIIIAVLFLFKGAMNAIANDELCYFKKSLIFDNSSIAKDEYLIESDRSIIEKKNNFNLLGNVKIKSSNLSLNADKVLLNSDKKNFYGDGNVQFHNNYLFFNAKNANIQDSQLEAEKVDFVFTDTSTNGKAGYIKANEDLKFVKNAVLTTCDPKNRDWFIQADSITLDSKKNKGNAKNAFVKFFGVPILFHPNLDWTLSGRGSGFLAPSFSSFNDQTSGSSEFQISIPYYFNLAKDSDLLLTLNHISNRGANLSSKYRQLLYQNSIYKSGRLQLENDLIHKDKVTGKTRWKSKNNLDFIINDYTDLSIQNYRVSDANYFNDISNEESEDSLLSFVDLKIIKNYLNFSITAENIQNLNNSLNHYYSFPEIYLKHKNSLKHDVLNETSLSFNAFKNSNLNLIHGNRTHLETSFEKSLASNYLNILPKLTLMNTKYNLSNGNKLNRSLYKLKVDASADFERDVFFLNKGISQSLTPQLTYNFTPKKNQSLIPNFDTEEIYGNYNNLFDSSKYTGIDKINNDNSISYGISSSFFDSLDGKEILSLNIGQKYYFDAVSTDINGNLSNINNSSNIFSSAEINFDQNLLSTSIEFDPNTNETITSTIRFKKLVSPKKFIGIDFSNDTNETLSLYGVYPVTKKLHLFGSLSRNLNTNNNNKELFGFGYETCCWEIRLAKFDSNIDNSDSINFELVLKDLASSSDNLKKNIDETIPGYINIYDF